MTLQQTNIMLDYINKNYKHVNNVRVGSAEVNFDSMGKDCTITWVKFENEKGYLRVLERFNVTIPIKGV